MQDDLVHFKSLLIIQKLLSGEDASGAAVGGAAKINGETPPLGFG